MKWTLIGTDNKLMATEVRELRAEVAELKKIVGHQKSLLRELKNELQHKMDKPANGGGIYLSDSTKIPMSCEDLSRIGHSLSGLYSVMGAKQIESVFCDFAKSHDHRGKQNRNGLSSLNN